MGQVPLSEDILMDGGEAATQLTVNQPTAGSNPAYPATSRFTAAKTNEANDCEIPRVGDMMEEIYHNVFVGDDTAYNRLKDKDNWAFLRCCKFGPGGHKDTLGYETQGAPDGPDKYWVRRGHRLALNLLDLDDPNFVPAEAIQAGLDFAREELLSGRKLLIACNQGKSRGPTVGLMFLRSIGDMPHAYLLSQRIYHTIYDAYQPSQGIEQFARSVWPQLGETGRV